MTWPLLAFLAGVIVGFVACIWASQPINRKQDHPSEVKIDVPDRLPADWS